MKNLNLIKSFLEVIYIEHGLAENTISSYKNDLRLFSSFVESKNTNFLDLNENIITDYLQKLYNDNISPTSVSRKISTIRTFFQFLEQENHRNNNPASNITKPRNNRKLPKVLTEKEVLLLIKTVNQDNSDFGIRLSCMLEILYASGMRVSELVSLPISVIQKVVNDDNNITLKNYLIIKGKGDKERITPLNNSALEILIKYLNLREEIGQKESKWLFPGNFRINKNLIDKNYSTRPLVNDKHLTRQRFHQMLKELALITGIDEYRVSPHIIRHSFASHLLNNGINLRILQELLGHSDISTTQIYTHILDTKLQELIRKHHPLAKKL